MQPTIAGTPVTAHDEEHMVREIAAAPSAHLHGAHGDDLRTKCERTGPPMDGLGAG